MVRPTIAFFTVFFCLSTANASLSPAPPLIPLKMQAAPQVQREASTAGLSNVFQVSEQTEIYLDGRLCKYKDVPSNVDIILLEVASNNPKEVLKIQFRTRK